MSRVNRSLNDPCPWHVAVSRQPTCDVARSPRSISGKWHIQTAKNRSGLPQMFKQMATVERVKAAKQKTERVADHLLQLIALHENNVIVVHSDALALQIQRSYAANAFNVFQQSLYRFEIVRLCALWDRAWPDLSRESIPTIVELIADANVIDALVEERL